MVANKSTLKRSRPADVDTTTSKRGRNASVNIQPTVSTSKTGAASGSSTSNNDTGLVSPGVNRSSTGRGGKRGKTSPGSRYDSSLGLLTKKFIALIKVCTYEYTSILRFYISGHVISSIRYF